MGDVEYGLGIDIGDGAVAAAICDSGGAEARPLRTATASAAVELEPDGSVRLGAARPETEAVHVMARVGTPVPLWIDGRGIPAAEVASAIVREVRARAEAQEGRPPSWTVVTVPPSWRAYRRAALTEALASESGDTSVVSAAVAVTRHHVAVGDLPVDPAVAVYDAGASTLDTAVVGSAADGSLDHLAVPAGAFSWGGADIDDAVLGHVLSFLDPPAEPGDGVRASALRAGSVAVKEALSTETVAQLDDPAAGAVRVTREELDELIAPDVERTVAHLRATIAAAGLTDDDLDAVVLAGGCARVPLVAERLSADLGRPIVVAPEPELTAALGAALVAVDALSTDAPTVPARHVVPSTVRATRPGADSALVRPPAGAGARGPHGVPRPSGGEHDRRATRVLIVAAMFVGLMVLVPTLLSLLSSSVGPAPAGSAVAAGPSAGTTSPDAPPPPPGPGGAAFAGVEIEHAAQHRSVGTGRASAASSSTGRSTRTAGQQTPAAQTGATGTTAAGAVPPAADSSAAAIPATTDSAAASDPVGTGTPTPGPSSDPATPPPTTPAPTTPPPTTPAPTTPAPTTPAPTTPASTTAPPTTAPPTTSAPEPAPEPAPGAVSP